MKFAAKSKGFSLIELLISLVILSISLLALASLMVTTTRGNSSGSHMTEAVTLAQDKLEELRATPWTTTAAFSGADPSIVGSTGITYTRNWSPPNPPAVTDALRTVTVTVTWLDRVNRSVSMVSVLTE